MATHTERESDMTTKDTPTLAEAIALLETELAARPIGHDHQSQPNPLPSKRTNRNPTNRTPNRKHPHAKRQPTPAGRGAHPPHHAHHHKTTGQTWPHKTKGNPMSIMLWPILLLASATALVG